ncbi:tetraspanin-31-like isoform X1 [Hydractinia symbiolongicarpus]|uniref:tetraspanin-31-like isoform X1 n=1 Tax=Hydractinia symbiolongicarpus TaxID=13093 RepID=UPI00254CE323|nr:tetraspanin-31-like isoform X1 [Hydractinia symbiolongicarpus]
MTCFKFVLSLFSGLFLLLGLGFVSLFTWLMIKNSQYDAVTGSKIVDISFMSFASLICLIAILGCCGIHKENERIIKLYVILIFTMLVFEMSLLTVWFTQKEKIEVLMKSRWHKMGDENRIRLQKKLSCCSMDDITTDYNSTMHSSCYVNGTISAHTTKKDCFSALIDYLKDKQEYIFGVLAALVFIEVTIIVFSYLFLCIYTDHDLPRTFRNNHTKVVPMPFKRSHLAGDVELCDLDYAFPADNSNKRYWAKHTNRHTRRDDG